MLILPVITSMTGACSMTDWPEEAVLANAWLTCETARSNRYILVYEAPSKTFRSSGFKREKALPASGSYWYWREKRPAFVKLYNDVFFESILNWRNTISVTPLSFDTSEKLKLIRMLN